MRLLGRLLRRRFDPALVLAPEPQVGVLTDQMRFDALVALAVEMGFPLDYAQRQAAALILEEHRGG